MFAAQMENKNGTTSLISLIKASDTKIQRHTKIKGDANPYDSEWEEYFEKRLLSKMKDALRGKVELTLWMNQGGKCPVCGGTIQEDEEYNIHHIQAIINGGRDTLDNLVLLHGNCHRQVHSQKLYVSKPAVDKMA